MSSKVTVIVVALVLTVAVSALVSVADDRREVVMNALGEQNYFNCGMDKLNERERTNLFGLIGAYPVVSYTESAAAAYLRKKGWREIQVLGAVVVDTVWNERHLIVADHYELYLLDPTIVPYLLDPGIYWAYGSGSAWKLLYPDGYEGSFWASELE